MRILVTGATGFIGRAIVNHLIELEHEVIALVRETSNRSGIPEEVEFVEGNMLDLESLENAVKDVKAVIHLAAYFDFYPSDADLMYRVNVEGTRNLLDACVGSTIERFIYGSTTETIGPVRYPPGNEDTELRPQFDYGKSKVIAERSVRELCCDTGIEYVIIRPTGVMGEGDQYTAFELIEAINNGDVPVLPGDGEKHIMYTHIDDVVEGFVAALSSKSAANETIILCPDHPMKYKQLIEYLGDILGVKAPKRYVSTTLAKVGIGLLSPLKNRGKTTFLWHTQTIQSMDEDRWYSNDKAKKLLGWKPQVTMEEGIKREIEWAWEMNLLERRKE